MPFWGQLSLNANSQIFNKHPFPVHGPFKGVCVSWPGSQVVAVQLAKPKAHVGGRGEHVTTSE